MNRPLITSAALCLVNLVGFATVAAPAAAQELIELPAEDRRLDPGFEEVFRAGGIDGEPWEQFGRIQDADFDRAGNLYLLDSDVSTVVVVDREGSFVRTIGRSGDGPGEFDFPRWLAVMEDGRIVVGDVPRHRAFQIYNSDGSFDRGVRVGNDLLAVADRIHGGRDGIVLTGVGLARIEEMIPEDERDPPGKRRILRAGLDGDEVALETVFHAWSLPPVGELTLRIGGREIPMGGVTPPPRTFGPPLIVGTLPQGGLAFSDSSAYVIKVLDADGTLVRILSRPLHPVPVTDRIVETEFERRVEEAIAGFEARGQGNRIIQNATTGRDHGGIAGHGREHARRDPVVDPGPARSGPGGRRSPGSPGSAHHVGRTDLGAAARRGRLQRRSDRCTDPRRPLPGQLSPRNAHADGPWSWGTDGHAGDR